jgi:hypothetical protein
LDKTQKTTQMAQKKHTTGEVEPKVINDSEIEGIKQDLLTIASALLDQMNYVGNRIISGSQQNKVKLRAIIEKYSNPKTLHS